MINKSVPPVRSAVRRPSRAPWPYAPSLELPAGALRNYGAGRVLSAQQFVLAVGLSPQHYAVVSRAPGVGPVGQVLEQAAGFLAGCGAQITRVPLRCRMAWFQDSKGDFLWRRCVLFFARMFLSAMPAEAPWLPAKIWPAIALRPVVGHSRAHWEQVAQMLEGLAAGDQDLLLELGGSLASLGRRWEYYLAQMVLTAQRAGEFGPAEREAVARCDRLFYSIMTRYEPGYELLPATITRLL